jgi:hypothetical protein
MRSLLVACIVEGMAQYKLQFNDVPAEYMIQGVVVRAKVILEVLTGYAVQRTTALQCTVRTKQMYQALHSCWLNGKA